MARNSGPSLAQVSHDLVLPTVPSLTSSEKVFSLREENMLAHDRRRYHRFQIIQVVRNDRMVEYSRDLGSTDNFLGVGDILLVSLFQDSVDFVMDEAERLREANHVKPYLDELAETSTIVEDAVRIEEQKQLLRKRNSRTLPKGL